MARARAVRFALKTICIFRVGEARRSRSKSTRSALGWVSRDCVRIEQSYISQSRVCKSRTVVHLGFPPRLTWTSITLRVEPRGAKQDSTFYKIFGAFYMNQGRFFR